MREVVQVAAGVVVGVVEPGQVGGAHRVADEGQADAVDRVEQVAASPGRGWRRVIVPLLFSSQAAVSVNDAPPPSNGWYVVFSLTVMVWLAEPPAGPKVIGVCCCRPRVTLRPPASLVVVSQTLTCSPAAWAGGAVPKPSPAAATHKAATADGRAGGERVRGHGAVLPCSKGFWDNRELSASARAATGGQHEVTIRDTAVSTPHPRLFSRLLFSPGLDVGAFSQQAAAEPCLPTPP